MDGAGPAQQVLIGAASPRRRSPRTLPFGRPMLGEAERAAVIEVLEGPVLTHGPRVKVFEEAFAAFTGAPSAVATSSCTASLRLAFLFLGLGPGDEVIVPALSHVATAHTVELCGSRCVFVDSEPRTGNIDLDRIESHVTDRTRAIAVVHFLGMPVDMGRVTAIARKHDLFVVEDCALALGARLRGVHVGLLGDVGCFSFYPVKHITTGEGGMTITSRPELARMNACQRAFGIDRTKVDDRAVPGEYDVHALGSNYRMSEISAALGCEQMRRLPDFLRQRRGNYEILSDGLLEIDEVEMLESSDVDFESACYSHCVILKDEIRARRPEVIESLRARGVGTSIYYPRPIPLLSWYRDKYGHAETDFPVASTISGASITLPVGPHLDGDDMRFIAGSLRRAIRSERR